MIKEDYANDVFKYRAMTLEERNKFARQSDNLKEKTDEKPEPFFYCNVAGIASICCDCKRNYLNSVFRTEDIKNWYSPQYSSNFKICEGYIFNKNNL